MTSVNRKTQRGKGLGPYKARFEEKTTPIMKIRKLILKAKLQQIEKECQYVFIYHCSGITTSQWRQLKDLLFKTQAKTFFQPKNRQKKEGAKPESSNLGSKARCDRGAKLSKQASKVQSNSKVASLSGPFCIFYLTPCDEIEVRKNQSTHSWGEVLKKIESFTSSGSQIVLLYAQMQSTIVNHIDIKQALNLETRSVYQQLLSSMQYPVQSLDFCFHQNINQIASHLEILSHPKKNENDLS